MDSLENAVSQLQKANIPFALQEPLKNHTTFKIGGPAAIFVTPQNPADLARALRIAREYGLPYYLLGCGSNVLFCDEGYEGMVLHLIGHMDAIRVEGRQIVAEAGAMLADVCRAAQRAGLTGLEFAYGIPGSVGGAVFMDAGAFGGDMRQVLADVRFLDDQLEERSLPAAKLQLGYRESIFHEKPWCILEARFCLQEGDADIIAEQMRQYMALRVEKQPLEMPNAGSAFKRPEGAYAGALIDSCGLRGLRVGDAAISEKHCGFIVNHGNATCTDVLELVAQVTETVHRETGFRLEPEIRFVGPREHCGAAK